MAQTDEKKKTNNLKTKQTKKKTNNPVHNSLHMEAGDKARGAYGDMGGAERASARERERER